MEMSSARRSLIWILLCASISVFWGGSIGQAAGGLVDFRAVYFGARCLMEHVDPYIPSQFEQLYNSENGDLPRDPLNQREFRLGVFKCMNLPTTLFLMAPLAMLPWEIAHLLWMALIAGSLIGAAFLIWRESESCSSRSLVIILCILLANAETLIGGGNSAGIVVSLCVFATWCLVKEKYAPAGVLCLALALAIKPHDAGFIWLYFVLLGGARRKRAFQALIVTAVLVVPAVLWASIVAPNWPQELRTNLQSGLAPGGINEPGPYSITGSNAGMVISLQAAISVLTNDPTRYNAVTYLICGAMLLVWALRTVRLDEPTESDIWLGLVPAVTLTLLITYHRSYDAKLLLIAIPACALLFSKRGSIGRTARLSTLAVIVFTADIPLTIWTILRNSLPIETGNSVQKIVAMFLLEPTPLLLLVMTTFFLWVYLKQDVSLSMIEDPKLNKPDRSGSDPGPAVVTS
jgi:hypothetical protein